MFFFISFKKIQNEQLQKRAMEEYFKKGLEPLICLNEVEQPLLREYKILCEAKDSVNSSRRNSVVLMFVSEKNATPNR